MAARADAVAGSKLLRALLIGPTFLPKQVGGLQIALHELADQLGARGWQIDAPIYTTSDGPSESHPSQGTLRNTYFGSGLAVFQRWPSCIRLWSAMPSQMRSFFSMLFMSRRFIENASQRLEAVDKMMAEYHDYDVVLLCVDGSAPGVPALVAHRHQRVAVLSLVRLGSELRADWWPWMRRLALLRLRGRVHPFLYRRIEPHQIRLAVFASQQWREEAIRAGLPAQTAQTIYFGVPSPEPLPRPTEMRGRILYVGRLSREKGLHLLLHALPGIRESIAGIRLTVIAAKGPAAYHRGILDMVRYHGLQDVVTLHPPVDRTALQKAYAEHDVLFFHSVYPDPVALVLMEAFAAGLPVVASQAPAEARLVQDRATCLCYRPYDSESLTAAIVTMLTDAPLRKQLAQNAQQLIRQEFSLQAMGQAYDSLLRKFVAEG